MSTLLAIDPGKNENAWALFDEGALCKVGMGDPPDSPIDECVIERPEYQGVRSLAARPQDLMGLSWNGARLAGFIVGRDSSTLLELTPSAWKGQARKPQHHLKLWRVLTPAERDIVGGVATERVIRSACEKGALDRWKKGGGAAYYPRAFFIHNLLDAVALGCHYLGRAA